MAPTCCKGAPGSVHLPSSSSSSSPASVPSLRMPWQRGRQGWLREKLQLWCKGSEPSLRSLVLQQCPDGVQTQPFQGKTEREVVLWVPRVPSHTCSGPCLGLPKQPWQAAEGWTLTWRCCWCAWGSSRGDTTTQNPYPSRGAPSPPRCLPPGQGRERRR